MDLKLGFHVRKNSSHWFLQIQASMEQMVVGEANQTGFGGRGTSCKGDRRGQRRFGGLQGGRRRFGALQGGGAVLARCREGDGVAAAPRRWRDLVASTGWEGVVAAVQRGKGERERGKQGADTYVIIFVISLHLIFQILKIFFQKYKNTKCKVI